LYSCFASSVACWDAHWDIYCPILLQLPETGRKMASLSDDQGQSTAPDGASLGDQGTSGNWRAKHAERKNARRDRPPKAATPNTPAPAPSIAGSEYGQDDISKKFDKHEAIIKQKARDLENLQRALEKKKEDLEEKEAGLNKRFNELRELEKMLDGREAAIIKKEVELQEKESKLSLEKEPSKHRENRSKEGVYDMEAQKADIEKVYSRMKVMEQREFELRKLLKDLDMGWVLGAGRAS
ncbi:hypothetical protein QBC34DRAFT_413113, partial [Podospora aff. communis PSN243]